MRLDVRDAFLTPKQQKDLRFKRGTLLFIATYLCGLFVAVTALVTVTMMAHIDTSGESYMGWIMGVIVGPGFLAAAVTAVYVAVTQWHFLDTD